MGNRNGRLREQQAPLASDVAYPNAGPAYGVVSLFSDVPRVLLAITILLVLILIFAIASLAVLVQTKNECATRESATQCGAGGKDVSGLAGNDALLFSREEAGGVSNYYLKVCGSIPYNPSSTCANEVPYNSQAYVASSSQGCFNFASYQAGVGRWSSTDTGLTYYTSNGGSRCGSTYYSLYVYFECNPDAVNAFISNVSGFGVCQQSYIVQTREVC